MDACTQRANDRTAPALPYGGLTYGGFLPARAARRPSLRGSGYIQSGYRHPAGVCGKLAEVPLLYEPGSRWSYSMSTDVCGYLVEAMSGQPFESFLQDRLFGPRHARHRFQCF